MRDPACPPAATPAAEVPGGLSTADVYRLFSQAMDLGDRIPETVLSSRQRRALGGHVFADAPRLVSEVARVLRARAELFPDVQVDPSDLLRRQERALAWECLRNGLRWLADRAGQQYVADQARVVQDAVAVLEQVRSEQRQPFPRPRHLERRQALAQAEQVLRQQRRFRRRPAPRRQPAGPGSAEPAGRPPGPGVRKVHRRTGGHAGVAQE